MVADRFIDPWPNQHELKTLNTHNVSLLSCCFLPVAEIMKIAQWTKDNWNKRGQLHHLQFYRVVSFLCH